MSPLQWYRTVPRWMRDYVAAWGLAAAATFLVTKGLWAQTGAGSGDASILGLIERNIVPLAAVLVTGAVGLSRLSRLERDIQEYRTDTASRRQEVDRRIEAVGDEHVTNERFEGYVALATEQHMQLLNRLDGLHQSIKDIRRDQQFRIHEAPHKESGP